MSDNGHKSGPPSEHSILKSVQVRRFVQYGAIKVVPGLVGIFFVPLLFSLLGSEDFGQYSLMQGYGLLLATVLGAVVTQPMYRFLSSDREEFAPFVSVAVLGALVGGTAAGVLALILSSQAIDAALLGVFSASAILFTFIGVYLQIQGLPGFLASLEALRVTILLGVTLSWMLLADDFQVTHALSGLCLSFLIPVLPFVPRVRFARPSSEWIRKRLGYGTLGALWLSMAGLPFLLAKFTLDSLGATTELGAFAAVADFTYRVFGLLNAAITMTVFPALSREYDRGNLQAVRQYLRFALSAYLGASAVIVVLGAGLVWNGTFDVVVTPLGIATTVMVVLAALLWQLLSIAHKPDELRLRMVAVVARMAVSLLVFIFVVGLVLWTALSVHAPTALATGIILASMTYLIGSIASVTTKWGGRASRL